MPEREKKKGGGERYRNKQGTHHYSNVTPKFSRFLFHKILLNIKYLDWQGLKRLDYTISTFPFSEEI